MRIIEANNVNDAWWQAVRLINEIGVPEPSRAGDVLVAPYPVVTEYDKPVERVLFCATRDANPIFHLHEALWMLAGSNDATWLDQFVGDFSARFAEEDGLMHGAYGFRWRNHFEKVGSFTGGPLNQLAVVIRLLSNDPHTRQAVIQMWDPEVDLGPQVLKDRPCNTQVLLRINDGRLDMSTTVRSNDIVWGAYGANAVHFTVLQEYLAARIDVPMGKFYQYSWNWHMYENTRHLADPALVNSNMTYPGHIPMIRNPDVFDKEVKAYVRDPNSALTAENTFLENTARLMLMANKARKEGNIDEALKWAHIIVAPDWRQATMQWLERRRKK